MYLLSKEEREIGFKWIITNIIFYDITNVWYILEQLKHSKDNAGKQSVHSLVYTLYFQIEMVCQQLAEDPQLQGGFHAVGFSQVSCIKDIKP